MATQGGNGWTLSAEEVDILNDYRRLPLPQQAACSELLAATVALFDAIDRLDAAERDFPAYRLSPILWAAVRGDVIGTA